MKVATCQLPEVRGDMIRAMSLMRSYALEAERRGADLVCFPECFLQGYDIRPEHVGNVAVELGSSTFNDVLQVLGSAAPVVVFGLIEKHGSFFYNSALAIKRGEVIAHYRKTHLLKGEARVFERGNGSPIFDVGGIKVGINICYDLSVSGSIEGASALGATLLACPCSNMMPRDLAEEWKPRHNEIRSRHAKEHGIWIVSSDITGERDNCISYGPTAVIDPLGTVVAQVPLLESGVVVADIS
jgi:predicted amidohydrolase